jgi:hypothetical protein
MITGYACLIHIFNEVATEAALITISHIVVQEATPLQSSRSRTVYYNKGVTGLRKLAYHSIACSMKTNNI